MACASPWTGPRPEEIRARRELGRLPPPDDDEPAGAPGHHWADRRRALAGRQDCRVPQGPGLLSLRTPQLRTDRGAADRAILISGPCHDTSWLKVGRVQPARSIVTCVSPEKPSARAPA